MEAAYLLKLGMLQKDEGQKSLLLESAVQRALVKTPVVAGYVEYLLHSGQKVKALELIKNDLINNPTIWKQWLLFAESYSLSFEDLASAFPDSTALWYDVGNYRLDLGDTIQTEYLFTKTLELMENDPALYPKHWYSRLYNFFKSIRQVDKAVLVIRLAISKYPREAVFQVEMAEYYLREGIRYKAAEHFREALRLDPHNEQAMKAMKHLDRKE